MKKRKFEFLNIILLSIVVISIDQISKYIAFNVLERINNFYIIPGFIRLNLVKNTGAAFSIFSGNAKLLALISILVIISILIWIWYNQPFSSIEYLGFAFLLGGTIGNFLDRFRVGYVTDFIELTPINFPIFNFADISINLAILFFLLNSIKNND
tara:strand:+ start:1833 stop:2297 length:465 start_codon:yes stop_codon:yes gene_type:complete